MSRDVGDLHELSALTARMAASVRVKFGLVFDDELRLVRHDVTPG